MTGSTRIVTDFNGRIIGTSQGAARLLGIEERWLEGKPLAAYVAREHVKAFRTLLIDLSHGKGPVGASLLLQRRDGERTGVPIEAVAEAHGDRLEWLLAEPSPVEDEGDGAPLPVLEGLPLRRLLARLPVGVVSVDESLTVVYMNPAARVLVPGARSGELLPDPLPDFSLRKFARRLFTETPPVLQVVETQSGRLLELDGIPGGESDSALLLVQDITYRERRRRAEHEFAANAAHELQTPIAAITSSLEVLRNGAKEVPADLDLFLGHISKETARLAKLVAALLLLARIQTGQEQPSLQLVDVAPLLDEVAANLEPRDGVSIVVDCPADLAALTDDDLLRQAVWNVAVNAVRHTEAGEIRLTGRDVGRMAEIEVRDTGSGIAAADRERIFDRFYRVRDGSKGFGLGLPISREIAQALGGSLALDSEAGIGTRVRVSVPSARLVA